jgi:hypothetical protein
VRRNQAGCVSMSKRVGVQRPAWWGLSSGRRGARRRRCAVSAGIGHAMRSQKREPGDANAGLGSD